MQLRFIGEGPWMPLSTLYIRHGRRGIHNKKLSGPKYSTDVEKLWTWLLVGCHWVTQWNVCYVSPSVSSFKWRIGDTVKRGMVFLKERRLHDFSLFTNSGPIFNDLQTDFFLFQQNLCCPMKKVDYLISQKAQITGHFIWRLCFRSSLY